MFKTSHLQELKRRYASMYAQPIEEVIEDGTIEGRKQYQKDTPGQEFDKEFEEHCGVCGHGIKEVEVEESFELQATMALDDAGVKSKWKKGKLYVAKRDIKKAEKALGKSFKNMKKGAEPDLWYEEIGVDEGSSDTTDMYNLMIKGMKAVPGSPKQKEIIKQINVVRKRMGMPLMKEEIELNEL